ncbi:unnamed protein product [Owenia fusiformis]|uniref:Uncharacterized protein n=1 Tax=Owenia fusiformis TaxID=6347 RepID=A0A8J1UJA6_OWEFU|nr:unnamed protein product [Owenia fusiformis]
MSIKRISSKNILDESNKQLTELPHDIFKPKTSVVNLSRNQLIALPDQINELEKSLEKLNIERNQFSNVPEQIANLKNLTWLHISNNPIDEIPENICQLVKLRSLFCWSTYITDLPFKFAQLQSLQQLDISHNKLTHLPSCVYELKNLIWLDFDDNQISEIDPKIGNLTKLKTLRVHKNKLTSLPSEISKLQLRELNVSQNNIDFKSFEEVISKLKSLEILDFERCGVSRLPESITKLVNLKTFGCFNNPLQYPPEAICTDGMQSIKSYFIETKNHARLTSKQKVVYVGETLAGKTSLIHGLTKGVSQLTRIEDRTRVLEKTNWDIASEHIEIVNYDLGGNEIYRPTHPLLLSQRAIYILTTDIYSFMKEDDKDDAFKEKIWFWLHKLQDYVPGSRVIVVATHFDLCETDKEKEDARDTLNTINQKIKAEVEKIEVDIDRKLEDAQREIKEIEGNINENNGEDIKAWRMKEERLKKLQGKILHVEDSFLISSNEDLTGVSDLKRCILKYSRENQVYVSEQMFKFMKELTHQSLCEPKRLSMREKDLSNFMTTRRSSLKNLKHKMRQKPEAYKQKKVLTLLSLMGEILYYPDQDALQDVIFHNIDRMIELLRAIFRHDRELFNNVNYDKDHIIITCCGSKQKFEDMERDFRVNAILHKGFFLYLCHNVANNEEAEIMLEVLQKFNLCFKFDSSNESLYHFPWYQTQSDGICIHQQNRYQLTLEIHFTRSIPDKYFKKVTVLLQKYIDPSGRRISTHISCGKKDYTEICVARKHSNGKYFMPVRLYGIDIEDIWRTLMDLYKDMINLLVQWPGVYYDVYLVCPHCLRTNQEDPFKYNAEAVLKLQYPKGKKKHSWKTCEKEGVKLPAALVWPVLYDPGVENKEKEDYKQDLKSYESFTRKTEVLCTNDDLQVKNGSNKDNTSGDVPIKTRLLLKHSISAQDFQSSVKPIYKRKRLLSQGDKTEAQRGIHINVHEGATMQLSVGDKSGNTIVSTRNGDRSPSEYGSGYVLDYDPSSEDDRSPIWSSIQENIWEIPFVDEDTCEDNDGKKSSEELDPNGKMPKELLRKFVKGGQSQTRPYSM